MERRVSIQANQTGIDDYDGTVNEADLSDVSVVPAGGSSITASDAKPSVTLEPKAETVSATETATAPSTVSEPVPTTAAEPISTGRQFGYPKRDENSEFNPVKVPNGTPVTAIKPEGTSINAEFDPTKVALTNMRMQQEIHKIAEENINEGWDTVAKITFGTIAPALQGFSPTATLAEILGL